MSPVRILALIGLAILIALPAITPTYFLHLLIQILLWSFIYTAWALMGRFGFVSFGHGAFMGVGAYVPALLWSERCGRDHVETFGERACIQGGLGLRPTKDLMAIMLANAGARVLLARSRRKMAS